MARNARGRRWSIVTEGVDVIFEEATLGRPLVFQVELKGLRRTVPVARFDDRKRADAAARALGGSVRRLTRSSA